jgi:hypothetical protein
LVGGRLTPSKEELAEEALPGVQHRPDTQTGILAVPPAAWTPAYNSFVISHSFTVVLQLRMVIDLYRGDAMTLFNRLFVRSALRRCE